ncbi:MAG TPA: histidine kinase dimerization/phosphoacceptor domain -containing protein [Allosphingosinicella sp.]|jgi:two-component sensor histidine kinase
MDESTPLIPEAVLATPELYRRSARAADLETELEAYRELSSLMSPEPGLAIQRFLELAIELCPAAGSAGLSELGVGEDGGEIFTWTALAGEFLPYVGGTTPRDFSPCGLCLDHHHTILVERPARAFGYFADAEPQIVEGLIVPLYDTGKRPIGTLWVASHDPGGRFDATDARVMEQLAVQLVLAIKLRRKARVLMVLEQVVRDKDILVQEVHHRVKNTIQMTSALLHLQERGLASSEARAALKEAQSRLLVLANVHEALVQPAAGSDASSVDMAALVETLVSSLRESAPPSSGIRLGTACDAMMLPASEAVPLGLIVNEAVTNSLKHAFHGRDSGEVVVELRAGETCSLEIRDDGIGFAKAARDGSLGMRLIQSLSRQLKAKVAVSGEGGASVRLEWKRSAPVRTAEPAAAVGA